MAAAKSSSSRRSPGRRLLGSWRDSGDERTFKVAAALRPFTERCIPAARGAMNSQPKTSAIPSPPLASHSLRPCTLDSTCRSRISARALTRQHAMLRARHIVRHRQLAQGAGRTDRSGQLNRRALARRTAGGLSPCPGQGRVRSKGGAEAAARQPVFRWATLACSMNAWVSGPAQRYQFGVVLCPWPGKALENRIQLVTCRSSVRQAACVYSLIRPPRTGFRRICRLSTPVTVTRGASGSSSGTRWAIPWCSAARIVD